MMIKNFWFRLTMIVLYFAALFFYIEGSILRAIFWAIMILVIREILKDL